MRKAVLSAVLAPLVLVSALGVIHYTHEGRMLHNQLQVLRVEREQLQMEWSQLQLEESAWANRGRIERLARERLDMHEPGKYAIVVVEQ